jgi:hypothetical protein
MFTANLTWTALESKPEFRVKKPATNRLIHRAA